METNSFSAEFGRTGGGAVNIITKAGGNKYHGTAYYYHQNDFLNANSFVNNRFGTIRPVLRRHQYGFTVGGPVWVPGLYRGKNKTFFTAFEGKREKDPVRNISSVPTAIERSGDFSESRFLGPTGAQLIQIYDPNTSRLVNGVRSRDLFPGNVIPSARFNPVAQKTLTEYPDANRTGSSMTGRQNYLFFGNRGYSRDLFTTRVDHIFNERHRLFGRFSQQKSLDTQPSVKVRFTNSNNTRDSFYNSGFDDTYQITPYLFNVFRYMYVRYRAKLVSNTLGFDPTTLGLPSVLLEFGAYTYEKVESLSAYQHYMGTYFQDDWKVTSRLTVNLGVRWETETGTGEAHNRLTYFDPAADTGTGFKGALQFIGRKNPRTIRQTNMKNFGPRLGFAYRLTNKTAIRGGYGIFYLPIGLETAIVTTPFNYNVVADVFNADYSPKTTLSNPFPDGIVRPNSTNRLEDGSFRLGNNANIVLRDQPNSYVQQWNLAIGQQVGRTTSIDVTYF